MNFLVIVTCAAGISCPIQGEYKAHYTALSAAACRKDVSDLMRNFGQEPKRFKIVCKP